MFKIQTLNPVSPKGLEHFPRSYYDIAEKIAMPDAVLVRSYSMLDWPIPSSLKVVGRAGAGVNNIPITALTSAGIPVLNTPGANANAVRELVMAGMLLASRHIFSGFDYVRQLTGSTLTMQGEVEKNKKQFVGSELLNKTVGVIGLGHVGVKVANTAVHFGMKVIGFDPAMTVKNAWELSSEVMQADSLETVLRTADFITLHIPFVAETEHLLDHTKMALMKSSAVLLNFARDETVDHAALLTLLNTNKLRAYVTDFPIQELIDHKAVISLPHLGASTLEAEENCAVMIVNQVRHYLEQGGISHSVNFPSLEMPWNQAEIRLSIVNQNIPNMVAQISADLANAGLNIISLMNKSRDEIAYTLIDVNADATPVLLQQIADIPGVIQVRKIMKQ